MPEEYNLGYMNIEAGCFERRRGWGEKIKSRVSKLRLPRTSSTVINPLSENSKKKDLEYSELGTELADQGLGGIPTLIQMLDRAPTQLDRSMMLSSYSRGVAIKQLGLEEARSLSTEEESLVKFSSEEITSFVESRVKEKKH